MNRETKWTAYSTVFYGCFVYLRCHPLQLINNSGASFYIFLFLLFAAIKVYGEKTQNWTIYRMQSIEATFQIDHSLPHCSACIDTKCLVNHIQTICVQMISWPFDATAKAIKCVLYLSTIFNGFYVRFWFSQCNGLRLIKEKVQKDWVLPWNTTLSYLLLRFDKRS